MPYLAFALASLSGLAEPLGALVALFFLQNVSKSSTDMLNMENVLAFVAGIMITVALYELFPEANRHTGKGYSVLIAGTTAGIVVMMATELYLPTL
jgi:ZIP family zinc transporter